MPPKIGEHERQLKRAGLVLQKRQGKGSHRVYKHPNMREAKVTISGNPGKDASPYQESDVAEALEFVQTRQGESNDLSR
jgi:predicted RNA binding protein YcfA (HicA-like mRNA interferase family)